MRRPGLLAKARPTKASSIEARQHSGAGTKREYTHALQGTRREGGDSKTVDRRAFHREHASSPKFNVKRRCCQGGTSMRMRTNQTIMEHIFGNYNIKATM